MKISDLIKNIKNVKVVGKTDIEVLDIKTESNLVTKGCLFVALKGKECDGHDYIHKAEKFGAIAVVTEREVETNLTQIIVENARQALAIMASEFYFNPSKKMLVVGVVGTNGKTTTANLIYEICNKNNLKCGVIGTLGAKFGDNFLETSLTTPDPIDLHKILALMVAENVKVVVMEVSAHAIFWEKIYGIHFNVGIFTNLSRDHLDFFDNMSEYERVKMSFFNNDNCDYVVVNSDDETGRKIIKNKRGVITFGIDNPSDVFAIKKSKTDEKVVFNLFDCVYEVQLKLVGDYNLQNALGACTVASLLGIKLDNIVSALEKIQGVEGRLEEVYFNKCRVFIDYAHTPDGLHKTLNVLRPLCKNKLIVLFGCGGNRDKGKRFQMGEIAEKYADFVIVTSDNPRYEEPMSIIYDIEKGVLSVGKKYLLIEDRKSAIEYALEMAQKGDILLIAGKGAEKYQDVLGIKEPYNDKDTVIEITERGLR